MPVSYEALELPTLKAATAAVLKADGSGKAAPIKLTEARYFEQIGFASVAKVVMPTVLLGFFETAGVTHLLLITPYRDEAQMDTGRMMLGSGSM